MEDERSLGILDRFFQRGEVKALQRRVAVLDKENADLNTQVAGIEAFLSDPCSTNNPCADTERCKNVGYGTYVCLATIADNAEFKAALNGYAGLKPVVVNTYGPIEEWDVSKVTDFNSAFEDQSTFNEDISKWNVSQGTDFSYMFQSATAFNQPLNQWDVSQGKEFYNMFKSTEAFNQPLNQWDVSQGTDFSYMFGSATAFNQPLNQWNVSKGTKFYDMFRSANAFNQDLCAWSTQMSQGVSVSNMFDGSGCTTTADPAFNSGKFSPLCYTCTTN